MNDLRDVLERVASGDLDAEEAARLLGEMSSPAEEDPSGEAGRQVRHIRVQCEVGAVSIVGDAAVHEAAAEGRHKARYDGDTLVIEADSRPPGFVFGLDRFGLSRAKQELKVRVNPDLALRVDMAAGRAVVRGVKGPISASVNAGSLTIDGFQSPIDLKVEAGSVVASGRLDAGVSDVRCEVGRVDLRLEAGSSVRIDARSELGRVSLPGQSRSGSGLASSTSAVVGDGEGMLNIKAALGTVSVRAEQAPAGDR